MMLRGRCWLIALVALSLVAASCAGSERQSTPRPTASVAGDVDAGVPSSMDSVPPPATQPPVTAADGGIVVELDGDTMPFDRRLLGTNAPAWIAPELMRDPDFHDQIGELGTTVLRMPGGSWSNVYDWLGCEKEEATCEWHWASRPSDFAALLAGTGVEGMWTVSINGTAQEAAALVAFFNGEVGDTRVIGPDRWDRDWATVGDWAALRAAGGHPDPVRVGLWEVGNEVFGAKPSAGPTCEEFGWEDVWTCEGTVYVDGDANHDGYEAFRRAMKAVDPTIQVGAVGIHGDQEGWGGFGNDVIDASAGALDFYVVHDYGFVDPSSEDDVLGHPFSSWSANLPPVFDALSNKNPATSVPVAVTEYNLVVGVDRDPEGMMAEAINAFYIADTIGQMALHGASMANQWNLVNGEMPSGSDYGVLDVVAGDVNPQFYALAFWSRMGDRLVPVSVGFDEASTLSAYGSVAADGTTSLLVLNKSGDPIDATITVNGSAPSMTATADVMRATSLGADEVWINGRPGGSADLSAHPSNVVGPVDDGVFTHNFESFSITLLTLTPDGAGR